MENIQKLEETIATWYKDAPHLPVNAQKWLATNVWWLALIGVVLGVIVTLQFIFITWFAGALLGGIVGGLAAGALLGGIVLIASLVTVGFSLINLALIAMAIKPLQTLQKKGWTLLFIAMLVNITATLIGFVLKPNFSGLIVSAIVIAIGGYFLYEIRSYFGKTASKKTKSAA